MSTYYLSLNLIFVLFFCLFGVLSIYLLRENLNNSCLKINAILIQITNKNQQIIQN